MDRVLVAISDTHIGDKLPDLPFKLRDLLDRRKPELILHAGDITAERGLQQLNEIADTVAVRGDNDRLELPHKMRLEVDGKIIILTHGDRPWWKEYPSIYANKMLARFGTHLRWWNGYLKNTYQLFVDDQPDCIICGHLHYAFRQYLNQTLVINPGAVYVNGQGSQQGIPPSVAFLTVKPQAIQAEIVPLNLASISPPARTTVASGCLLPELGI